jgi:hypothetical protein
MENKKINPKESDIVPLNIGYLVSQDFSGSPQRAEICASFNFRTKRDFLGYQKD